MVTVAVRRRPTDRLPLRAEQWTTDVRFKAMAAARAALAGVGRPETDVSDTGVYTLAVRRLATDDERSKVTENYLCDDAEDVTAP